MELVRILFNRLSVQNLSVMLANIEVLILVLGQYDLLLVITQFEIRNIVFLLFRNLFAFLGLPFTLFPLFFQLFRCLLRLARLPPVSKDHCW